MYDASPAISVIGLHQFRFGHDWRAQVHAHAEAEELLFVVGGELELRAGERTFCGSAGAVFTYPRAMPHVEWNAGGTDLQMYGLFWRDPNQTSIPLRAFDRFGRVRAAFEWMRDIQASDASNKQRAIDGLMGAIVHELTLPERLSADPRLIRVQEHIRGNLAASLRLADLAAVAGMSPYHFAHEFRKAVGQPPAHYVRAQRVDAVRRLLISTDMPLRAIAPMVGFADEHELSRVFRRVTGHTPKSVRATGV